MINERQDTVSMMNHPGMINGRHVLTLGALMCMINERQCHIIGMYDKWASGGSEYDDSYTNDE